MKRSHMNFCKECHKAFVLTTNLDYCETCRIILDLNTGEDQVYETQPEIVKEIEKAYLNYGIVIH